MVGRRNNPVTYDSFGQMIQSRLSELDESISWLAQEINADVKIVTKYVEDKKAPVGDRAIAISEALGIRYDDLRLPPVPPQNYTPFGDFVRSKLSELEKSQTWLAERTGIRRDRINKIINGKGDTGVQTMYRVLEPINNETMPIEVLMETVLLAEEYDIPVRHAMLLEQKYTSFGQMLGLKLKASDKTHQWLADQTGIERGLLTRFVNGQKFPSPKKVSNIAQFVDLDQSMITEYLRNPEEKRREFGELVGRKLSELNETQEWLAQKVNTGQVNISRYCTGKSLPRADRRAEILAVLQVEPFCLIYAPEYDQAAEDNNLPLDVSENNEGAPTQELSIGQIKSGLDALEERLNKLEAYDSVMGKLSMSISDYESVEESDKPDYEVWVEQKLAEREEALKGSIKQELGANILRNLE